MTITRVWIEEGCISCGNSEDNCPEVFKVKDEGAVVLCTRIDVVKFANNNHGREYEKIIWFFNGWLSFYSPASCNGCGCTCIQHAGHKAGAYDGSNDRHSCPDNRKFRG